MDAIKKKKWVERIVTIVVSLIVICLLFFFFKDLIIPFIKLEVNNDFDGARDLLVDKGMIGLSAVTLIEALQMVVIFISAEFVQLSAGMAYPWWIAFILCDLGVIIGASIIYLLVNVFKISNKDLYNKDKINRYERMAKSSTSTIIMMYLLFIMPIVPYGAICYYGSGKKVPYFKYVLTCATGAIPSIATSIGLGFAIKEFITKSLPVWVLVLVIIGVIAILLTLLLFVFNKFFIRPKKGEPTPFYINLLEKITLFIYKFRYRIKYINKEKVEDLYGPYICIGNHHAATDGMVALDLFKGKTGLFVANEYLFRMPIIGKIAVKAGHIKKKMFTNDFACVKNIIARIRSGYGVSIFPEGRLSPDGYYSPIDKSIANLCKKLNVPVVLIQIRDNYFYKPKWRKRYYSGRPTVEIKEVISVEELKNMDVDTLYGKILDDINYYEFSNENLDFKQNDKAEGLHNLLYMCPVCKTRYTNISFANTLKCVNCNKEYHILNNYRFDDEEINNIHEYYERIKDLERLEIDNLDLDIEVDVKIFTDGVRKVGKEKGIFNINTEKISFKSSISDLYFEFKIHEQEAIAYSVNEEFELYYKNQLYYFYPKKDERAVCTRVSLLFDLLKEKENGQQVN